MNRPIKFRAWIVDAKKMIPEVHSGLHEIIDNPKFYLMQFTGLLDKNGKEIYEGDICKQELGIGLKPIVAPMIWNQSKAQFGLDAEIYFEIETGHLELTSKPEVIGNIYENPELLK